MTAKTAPRIKDRAARAAQDEQNQEAQQLASRILAVLLPASENLKTILSGLSAGTKDVDPRVVRKGLRALCRQLKAMRR